MLCNRPPPPPPFLFTYNPCISTFYTLLVTFWFAINLFIYSNRQWIIPKLYLNAGTANAPTAVILFLAFSSDSSIVLNLLVYSFFCCIVLNLLVYSFFSSDSSIVLNLLVYSFFSLSCTCSYCKPSLAVQQLITMRMQSRLSSLEAVCVQKTVTWTARDVTSVAVKTSKYIAGM